MAEEKKGFFKRLVSGLTKTRDNIVAGFDSIFSGFSSIDEDFYEELEEILIMGDIGINATTSIIENLKKEVSERHIKEPMECKQLLIEEIKDQMRVDSTEYEFENRKSVVLGDRCQWRWKDYFSRKACRQVKGPGQESDPCSSRYIPCSSRRTAD